MGYVILIMMPNYCKNYEIIRYRLSVLKRTMLREDHQTGSGSGNTGQGKDKELSESNKNLKEEIAKRKEVERQLKQALRDLSYYNEQLHLQPSAMNDPVI